MTEQIKNVRKVILANLYGVKNPNKGTTPWVRESYNGVQDRMTIQQCSYNVRFCIYKLDSV